MVWSMQAASDLTDKQFDQWSKLLEERAGISLGDQQRVFLQTQVSMRMRELGHSDYSQYYNCVIDGVSGKVEWSVLVDRLVVRETSFFRHKPSIDFVNRFLLERINERNQDGLFDLWSVGCSSGEEPYSLAMTIDESYEQAGLDPLYGIIATDISRAALNIAKAGLYSKSKVDMVSEKFRHRYFVTREDKYLVSPNLKQRICFNQANVLNISELPSIKLDVIFCQNLLVYFRRWMRHEILNAFAERLKPGGALVIGLGEVVNWAHDGVTRATVNDAQVYVKR